MAKLQIIDPVRDLLKQVEKLTGKEIIFTETKQLPVLARIHVASEGSPCHRLLFQENADEQINYAIANQCGHILRLYSVPEEKRFLPISSRRTLMSFMMETEKELRRLSALYGQGRMRGLIGMWFEGIVFQLTKMPTDIMIDMWLYDAYPELRAIQLRSLQEQRQVAIQSLAPAFREMVPAKVNYASHVMNYVFFKILEDHFHLDFVAPYYSTLFIFDGSRLARITEQEKANDHVGDRAMIDTWADHLGLSAWFEWIPFTKRPDDFYIGA